MTLAKAAVCRRSKRLAAGSAALDLFEMVSAQKLALVVVLAALVVPSAAFAGGAGDDQYLDPLQGLTGSGGTQSKPKSSTPKNSDGSSSSSAPSDPVSAAPTTAPVVTETAAAKSKPKTATSAPIKRPAIDVNGLSGIGSLVAVPVKHVTLVIGDIAHGRG